MSYADGDDQSDDDFYRWFVGGSPPEADSWPRHAFQNALQTGSIYPATASEISSETRRSMP